MFGLFLFCFNKPRCLIDLHACVPTEAQRLARIANAEFASAQADWFVDPEGQADPDGGLTDDDEWLGASWDDEAWDYPGA